MKTIVESFKIKRLLTITISFALLVGFIMNWVAISILCVTVPLLYWRLQLCRCHHCNGEGTLQGHDPYVHTVFSGQTCYICKGAGYVNPRTNHWYKIWQQANKNKCNLIAQKHEFRQKQAAFRDQFRPYIVHTNPIDNRENFSQFELTVNKRMEHFEKLIRHHYEIECYTHRILFNKYKEYAAQQWLQELQSTNNLNDEYYQATGLEEEAHYLEKYDFDIQGLEAITAELKALSVSEALVIELEASTRRLKQERAIA